MMRSGHIIVKLLTKNINKKGGCKSLLKIYEYLLGFSS